MKRCRCQNCMRGVFAAVLLVVVLSRNGSAQDDYRLWLNPRPNDFAWTLERETVLYSDADVPDEDIEFEALRHDFDLRLRLGGTSESEWLLSLDGESWSIDSDARFDESGRKVPQELQQVAAGVTYRRFLDNDWLIGQNLQFGSASNKPFDSGDELSFGGTTFLRLPSGPRNAWLMFLNFDTNRQFPVLPGLGYQFAWGKELRGVVGVPVLALDWSPVESTRLGLSYFPLKNVNAELACRISEPLTAALIFDWDASFYRRAGREDDDDRIEFEEKRLKLAVEYAFNEHLTLSTHGGYAFGRRLGEGDDYEERSENDIDLDEAWFGGVEVRWRH